MCFCCLLLDKSIPNPADFNKAMKEADNSYEHNQIVLDKLGEKVDNIDDYIWELHKEDLEPFGRQ